MSWLRTGLVITSLGALALGVLALVDCASPTQIVVDVYTDACPAPGRDPLRTIHDTGIAVSTPADVDTRVPTALKSGCESANGIGTLTIYPSGEKDAEVGIKVIGGVTTEPDKCAAPDYVGCIAHRQVVRFIPNTSQHVIVHLDVACLNRTCAAGQTCDQGVCKDVSDILADGGTVADSMASEAGLVDAPMDMPDAAIMAGDACAGCQGVCDQTKCTVDCSKGCNGELCAKTLPCEVDCTKTGKCANVSCTTSETCTINCGNEQASCGKVACNAGECDVSCRGEKSCDSTGGAITLDAGGTGTLDCHSDDQSCNTTVSCNATVCQLKCSRRGGPGGYDSCPQTGHSTCSGPGCTNWNTPTP